MTWHRLVCLSAAAAAVSCLAASIALARPAFARSPHDGFWSVVIITDSGSCDRAYRYNLNVQNGRVSYAGDASFDVQGRVTGNGHVRVSVSRGAQRADGSGRLARNFGNGTWRGKASSGECAGRWTAERR